MYDGLRAMFAWWMYSVCPVVCPVVGITDLLPPRLGAGGGVGAGHRKGTGNLDFSLKFCHPSVIRKTNYVTP